MKPEQVEQAMAGVRSKARERIDQSVRHLWMDFKDGSDCGVLADEDAELWSRLTMHPAIQGRIRAAFGTGIGLNPASPPGPDMGGADGSGAPGEGESC